MSSWGQEPCFLGECHSAVGTECWMRHLHKHLCSSGCWLTLVARKRARALNAQWIWVRDLAVSSAVSDEHRASDWVMVTGLTLQEKGWVCAGRRIMIWKWGGSWQNTDSASHILPADEGEGPASTKWPEHFKHHLCAVCWGSAHFCLHPGPFFWVLDFNIQMPTWNCYLDVS